MKRIAAVIAAAALASCSGGNPAALTVDGSTDETYDASLAAMHSSLAESPEKLDAFEGALVDLAADFLDIEEPEALKVTMRQALDGMSAEEIIAEVDALAGR